MTITTNILNTDHVKELLHKAAGLDKETGSTRNKQIMHRLLTDIYTMIEDLDITPEEFWQGVNYLNELGANGEAVLLAPGLGFDGKTLKMPRLVNSAAHLALLKVRCMWKARH